MPYLYKTNLYKNNPPIESPDVSADPAKNTQNNTDRIDFETNFKATARKIDELLLAGNNFIIGLSYTNFKAKITGSVLWSDVKYLEDTMKYVLNLLTDNPL